jgi:uncharacterized protein
MDFFNPEISLWALPNAETVTWQPIDKKYLTVLRITWLLTAAILLVILLVVAVFSTKLAIPGNGIFFFCGWLVLFIALFFIQEKAFPRRAYAIREHDILYRQGWIIEKNHACPFNRIQHCSVHSGPLERRYKLSSLTLNTAGSGQADLKIEGLPEKTAMDIREFIMKKVTGNAV